MPIPIKHKVERWARASLDLLTGFDVSSLDHKDMPDFQDERNSIGIEVVQDCYPDEKEHERFIEKIMHCPVDEIPQKQLDRLEREGGSIRVENNKIVGASLGREKANNPAHLIGTISKKTKLLNSDFKIFDSNRLYVYVDTVSPLYNSYVDTIIEAVTNIGMEYGFDTLYLFCMYEFITCDLIHKTFDRIKVTSEMISEITSMM